MAERATPPGYRDGWCIHYRRPAPWGGEDSCGAGVSYATFNGVPFEKRPCFLEKGQSKADATACEHLRLPTAEEIAIREEWSKQHWAKMVTVMQGIKPWREANKGRGATEIIACPACKGALHLSIARSNGHVHGHCETPDCVSWME